MVNNKLKLSLFKNGIIHRYASVNYPAFCLSCYYVLSK